MTHTCKCKEKNLVEAIISDIENRCPLSLEYAEDARYAWPERWDRIISAFKAMLITNEHPSKCKSESERMVECLKKLSETFHTKACTAMIHVGMYASPLSVVYYPDYRSEGTQFESVDAFEAWANSVCDNPRREIIHRKFKL